MSTDSDFLSSDNLDNMADFLEVSETQIEEYEQLLNKED